MSSEDIEYLAVPLFAHRLELAPGVVGLDKVIQDALRVPIEALSRATLR